MEGITPWEVPKKYPLEHIFRTAELVIKGRLMPYEILLKAYNDAYSSGYKPKSSTDSGSSRRPGRERRSREQSNVSSGVSITSDGKGTRYTMDAWAAQQKALGNIGKDGMIRFGKTKVKR